MYHLLQVVHNLLNKTVKANKILFSVLVPFLLYGCTTLNDNGRMVRQLNINSADRCEFTGLESIIFDSFLNILSSGEDSDNRIRNLVASKGSNAYRIQNQHENKIVFETYKCQEIKIKNKEIYI